MKRPDVPQGLRLLVVSDAIGPTQTISFGRLAAQRSEFDAVEMFTYRDRRASRLLAPDYWHAYRPSAIVFSRIPHEHTFDLIGMARRMAVPTIFHIDDDLLDVSDALGADRYAYYRDPDRLRRLRRALDEVDLVYASTGALASRLAAHGVAAPIVAGDIYCTVDPRALGPTRPATGPVIGYMGSAGHADDLAGIVPVICELMREIPSLRFETFGTIPPPPGMGEFGSRYGHIEGVRDYDAFFEMLKRLGWWVGMAPLADTTFNRCKADTKWVEYAAAGIPVVASGLPVYAQCAAGGACALATDAAQWRAALGSLIRDAARRERAVLASRALLAARYTHEKLRAQVAGVIAHARAHASRAKLS